MDDTASFSNLVIDAQYDIIDAETGHNITCGIQGSEAMRESWSVGAEAWPVGEEDFDGVPVEVAR